MDRAGLVCRLNDRETEAQLSAILYRPTSAGRTEIENKEDARKRGQASPDRAEVLVMAFCKIVPREQTVYPGSTVKFRRIDSPVAVLMLGSGLTRSAS